MYSIVMLWVNNASQETFVEVCSLLSAIQGDRRYHQRVDRADILMTTTTRGSPDSKCRTRSIVPLESLS
jgi:hypothetical protein